MMVLCHTVLMILCSIVLRTNGAGMFTHTAVAYRAISYFEDSFNGTDIRKLAYKHTDAFQTGVLWPDIFYNPLCDGKSFSSVAEDMHWMPYFRVALDYIRTNITQPWSEDDEKFIVFILAAGCHSVADIPWHGLGINDGTIDSVRKYDLNGDAHTLSDTGGDAINTFQMRYDQVGFLGPWYLPKTHIYNVWDLYYKKHPSSNNTPPGQTWFGLCTKIMLLGRSLEKLFMPKVYNRVVEQSVLLGDHMNDWFIGGLNDMADVTITLWKEMLFSLTHGTEFCNSAHNPLYWSCDSKVKVPPTMSMFKTLRQDFIVDLAKNHVTTNENDESISFDLSDTLKSELLRQGRYNENEDTTERATKPAGSVFATAEYTFLGSHVRTADINGDSLQDAIIGIPHFSEPGLFQRGQVVVVLGENPCDGVCSDITGDFSLNDLMKSSKAIILGSPCDHACHFGEKVVVLDFNADSILDLAIAAPRYGGDVSLFYTGAVFVYFGKENPTTGLFYASSPDVAIVGGTPHTNLGMTLEVHDVTNDGVLDLVIGSPWATISGERQRGLVAVFVSNSQRGSDRKLTSDDSDYFFTGFSAYDWFGMSVTGLSNGNLVFGCPGRVNANNDLKTGAVYEWDVASNELFTRAYGTTSREQYGTSLATVTRKVGKRTEDVVLVGSTHASSTCATLKAEARHQSGRVEFWNADFSSKLAAVQGDRRLSRFGHDIATSTSDGTTKIAISAPYWGPDPSNLWAFRATAGALYVFDLDELLAKPDVVKHSPAFVYYGTPRSQFGKSFDFCSPRGLLVGLPNFSHSTSINLSGKIEVLRSEQCRSTLKDSLTP